MKKFYKMMLLAAALLFPLLMQAQVTTFPYTEGFDEGLGDWTVIDNDGDGVNWYWGESDQCVISASYDDGNGALTPDNWLVSPQFTLGSGIYSLSWMDVTYDASWAEEHYAVYISTTGNTVDDFLDGEMIYEHTFTSEENSWAEVSYSLEGYAGQTIWIAFRHWDCTDWWQMGIDNITIVSANCPLLTGLQVSNVTSDYALLSWNGSSAYDSVKIDIDGETFILTGGPVDLSQLTPGTGYNVAVTAYCANGDSTTDAILFYTPSGVTCNITITAADSYGDGWNGATLAIVQNGQTIESITVPSDGGSGNGGIQHSFTVEVDGGQPVNFVWAKGSYDGECSFTIKDGSGMAVYTCTSASSFSGGQTVYTLDNACPTCIPPLEVTIGEYANNQVTFSWNAVTNAEEYLFTFGGTTETLTGTTITATNLEPGAMYEVQLRTNCGDGDSSGAYAFNYVVPCEPLELPFSDNFEADSADYVPTCWFSYNETSVVAIEDDSNHYLALAPNDIIVLNRAIDYPATGLRVAFNRHNYGTVYYGYMTDPSDISTFVQVGYNSSSPSDWSPCDFTIENLDVDGPIYLAFANNSSWYTPILDDISVVVFTGCKNPSGITMSETWVGDTSVMARWENVNAVGYELDFSTDYYYAESQTLHYQGITDTAATFTGLQPGTYYYFRIRTVCDGYTNGWSNSYSVTTKNTWPAVTGLYQGNIGYESASFNWYASSNAVNPVEGWSVGWRMKGETEWNAADLASDINSYTVEGLEQGVDYEFAVMPISGGAIRDGLSIDFTTLSCATRLDGTYTNNSAFTSAYYNYSFSEQLYLPSDLEGLGDTLSGISFYGSSEYAAQDSVRNVDIYLGNTSRTALGSWVPASELTLVKQNFSFTPQPGRLHIVFDSLFVRNADSSLVVAVVDHSGRYQNSFSWFGQNISGSRVLYYYNDENPINIDTLPSSHNTAYVLCQVTFDANVCEVPDHCEQPSINVVYTNAGYSIVVSPVQPNIAYKLRYRGYNYHTDWVEIADSVTTGSYFFPAALTYDYYEFNVYRECNGDTLSGSYYGYLSNCGNPYLNVWIDENQNYVVAYNGVEGREYTLSYRVYNNDTYQYDTVVVGQYTGTNGYDTIVMDFWSTQYTYFLLSCECTNGTSTSSYGINANCAAPSMNVWLDSNNHYVVTWGNTVPGRVYTLSYSVWNSNTNTNDTIVLGQYTGIDTVETDFLTNSGVYFYLTCMCDDVSTYNYYWISANCATPYLSYDINANRVLVTINNYEEGVEYNVYYKRYYYSEDYTLVAEHWTADTIALSGLSSNYYWQISVSRMCGDQEVFGYVYTYGDCGSPNVWTNNGYVQWEAATGAEYEISYYDNQIGDYVYLATVEGDTYVPTTLGSGQSWELRIGRDCSGSMQYSYTTIDGACTAPWFTEGNSTDTSMFFAWSNDEQIPITIEWGLRGGEYTHSVTLEAGDTSYTITGLESGTMYKVRLGRECVNGMTYSSDLYWNTLCSGLATVPYHNNFDQLDLNYYFYDPCWWKGTTSTEAQSGNNYPCVAYFSGNADDHMIRLIGGGWVAMPEMDAPINTLQVRVRYVAAGDDAAMILGLLSDEDTSFEQLTILDTIVHGDYGTEQSVWYTYRFDEVTDLTKNRIVFYGYQASGYYSNLAEVIVEVIPPCAEVGGLVCTGTDTTSATLTWNAAEGTFVEYVVEYGPKGFTFGEGQQATSTTNSIVLTGLMPATNYEAYVMVNCGRQGISHSSSPASFITGCVAVNDIVEDFQSYNVPGSTYYGILPNCWSYELTGPQEEAYFVPQVMAGNENYGDHALVVSSQAVVALPQLSRPLQETYITMEIPYIHEDNNASLVLGTVAHNGEGFAQTFEPLDTISVTGEYTYYLDQYTGENTILALKNINGNGGIRAYVVVSYVMVQDMPTCFVPQNVTAVANDAHSVTVDWEMERPMEDYAISIYSYGDGSWVDTIVHTHPFTVTGLQEQTSYYFYVYSICENDSWQSGGSYYVWTPEACPMPTTYYFDSIEGNSAMFFWEGTAENYLVRYGIDGEWGPLDTLTTNPYVMTNLRSGVYYSFQVYPFCDGQLINGFTTGFNTPQVCDDPQNFMATEVTTDHITLDWESDATAWHLRTSGGTLDTIVTNHPFTVENTIPGANYQFYLKAICSSLDESQEVVHIVGATPCDTMELTADNSLFENFDNLVYGSGWLPLCWSYVSDGGAYGYINGSLNHSGSKGIVIGSGGSTSPTSVTVSTKYFTADTAIALEFYYANMYGECTFRVGYDTIDTMGVAYTVWSSDTLVSNSLEMTLYRDTLPANAVRVHFQYFDNHGTSETRYLGIDDVSLSVLPPATCASPLTADVNDVTATSISIAVMGDTAATATAGYAVRLIAADGTEIDETTETGIVTFTGLTPATTYSINVRTLCGTVNSPWMQFGEVMTNCELVTEIPHFFDLSNAQNHALPACWAYDLTTQTNNHGWYPMHLTDYRTNNGIRMVGNVIFTLPEIETDLNTLAIDFSIGNENGNATSHQIQVGVVENIEPGFDSTFTPLATFDAYDDSYEVILEGYTGQSHRIAFRHVAPNDNAFYSLYVTDIYVKEAPACAAPANLHVVEATSNSIVIDWDDPKPASQWVIYYNDQEMTVGGHPITIEGLQPATTYDITVVTLCGDEEYYASMFALTECPLATLPYSTDFENYSSGSMPACWFYDAANLTENSGWLPQLYGLNNYGNTLLMIGNAVVAMPEFSDDLGGNLLTFKFIQGAGDTINSFEVGFVTDTDDGFATTFVPVDSAAITSNGSNVTVVLDQFSGNQGHIAFRQTVPEGSFAYSFIDNVSVAPAPTCWVADNLHATVVTNNSVTIDWTNEGEPTEWYVIVDGPEYFDTVVTSHPVTFTGLQQGANYWFSVQTICGDEATDYNVGISVNTECDVLTGLPIVFDFENTSLNCWETYNTYTNWRGTPYNNTLEFYTYSYGTSGYAVTPAIVTGQQQVVVDFDVLPNYNSNGGDYTITAGIYGEEPALTATFNEVQHYSFTVDVEDTVRFFFTNEVTTDGNYYYSYFNIDNIRIHEVANCPAPTNLTVVDATSGSITLDWAGSALSWQLTYTTAAGVEITTNVDAHPYTVNGLRPGSDFTFAVRGLCENGEYTEWSTVEANTACDVITELPFTYDFDNDAQGTMPACWAIDPLYTLLDNTNTIAGVPQVNYYSSINGSVLNIDYTAIVALPEMAAPVNTLTVDFNVIEVGGTSEEAMLIAGVVESNEAGFAENFFAIDTLYYTDADLLGHHSFDFAAYTGTGNRVAFRTVAPTDEWHYLSIDSVSINTTMTPCLAPAELTVVDVDINSAVIDWIPVGSENAWEVRVMNSVTYNVYTVTTHPATINGLARGTYYEVNVRALCGTEQVPGSWSNSLSFTTDYCHPGVPTDLAATDLTTESVVFSWTPAASDDSIWILKFVITAITDEVAEQLGVDFDSLTEDERTMMYDVTTNPYIYYNLIPGCTYSVSVATMCDYASSIFSQWSTPVSFVAPSCNSDFSFNASNVTTNSATITWTSGLNGSSYWVVLVPAGTPSDSVWYYDIYSNNVNNSMVTLTDLEPGTSYDLYVEGRCGSMWIMSDAFTFTTLRARYTATALVADSTMGTAVVSDANPWDGDTVTFMATAFEGYHFTHWSNGMTDANLQIAVTHNTNLTAYFAANVYTVTVNYDANKGSVVGATAAIAPGATFNITHGDSITLTATAAEDYRFVNWTDGYVAYTDTAINYTVTSDVTLTANFSETGKYYVTVNIQGEGTVTGAGEYMDGATANLTATAAEGSHFVHWITPTGTANTENLSFTVSADVMYTAVFALDSHTVSLSVADAWMGTVSGAGTYAYGTTVTITATPAEGFHFTGWSDNNTFNPRNITVDGDIALVADFDTNVYNVIVNINDAARGTVTGPTTMKHFTTDSLVAEANEGYHFVGWTNAAGNVLSTNLTLVISAVSDTTINALFAKNAYVATTGVNDTLMGTATVSNAAPLYLDVVTYTAVANYGYHFVEWSNGSTTASIQVIVTRDTNVTALFAVNSYTATAAVNDVTMGSATVSDTMPNYLDTVVFTAIAAQGYHFTGWSNGDTTATTSVVVTGNVTLTASFAINVYTVTVSYDSTRGGVMDAAGASVEPGTVYTVNHGTTLHFTADAFDNNSRFVNWTDGTIVDTSSTIDYVVTGDATLVANFASSDSVMLTLSVNDATMGSVTGAGQYAIGSTATITATAAAHHRFVQWTGADTVILTPSFTITLNEDMAFTAVFEPMMHLVNVSVNDATMGSVTPAGDTLVMDGSTFTAVAAANPGYHFVNWSTGATTLSITVTVTNAMNLVANFASDSTPVETYTVTADVMGQGTVTGAGSYEEGAECVLVAHAATGYRFVEWRNGDQVLGTDTVLTFTVTANITITAVFEQDGIDDVDMNNVNIYSADSKVIVRGAENQSIYVFDVNGRVIASETNASETCEFRMASTGVYLVKVGNAPAKRVLVVR